MAEQKNVIISRNKAIMVYKHTDSKLSK